MKQSATNKLQTSSQTNLVRVKDGYEMSIYAGDKLTPEGLAKSITRLKSAFPELGANFYDVFADRIKELELGDERLLDSVNYVIDNCVYPKPTIANFLGFDKKVTLYNYEQMKKINHEMHGEGFKYYKRVEVPGVSISMYASVQDIEIYKLKLAK